MKAECIGKHAPDGIKVLPFDLIGPPEELQQAAADAVQAFPDASLDYLIHNAGSDSHGWQISHKVTLCVLYDAQLLPTMFCVPRLPMLNVQRTIAY